MHVRFWQTLLMRLQDASAYLFLILIIILRYHPGEGICAHVDLMRFEVRCTA
jgi:hypothetical protein